MRSMSKGTAVARLYRARESPSMDRDCGKGPCFCPDIPDYLEEIGIWNLDTLSIEVLWAHGDFIDRSCIVALRNVRVVERRVNAMYSWRDSFDAGSSSKEIWGIARDSIPEVSQKNSYWWDPSDREARVKAIDLSIDGAMKYGEGKEGWESVRRNIVRET